MKLEDTVYKCITEYPSLYYFINHPTLSDFEISRLAVLEHLFCTNGNGYGWVDGYLVDLEFAKGADFDMQSGWTAESPKYGELTFADRIFPPQRTAHDGTPDKFAYEYGYMFKRPAKYPFSIYELSEYRIPVNIQPDWRQGAKDIFNFALACMSDKEYVDGSNKPITYKRRMKHIKTFKLVLKKLGAE